MRTCFKNPLICKLISHFPELSYKYILENFMKMLLSTPRSCHALKRESRGVRLPVPLYRDSSAVGHVFALDSLQIIVKHVSIPPELLITAF